MRVFTDHCVHTDVVEALLKIGVEVERAIEKGLERSPDEEIFNYILKSSQVFLTFDKDFGNIIRFDIKSSKGVVIIYTEKMMKTQIIKTIINFFQKIKEKDLKGKLFVIEPRGIRVWAG